MSQTVAADQPIFLHGLWRSGSTYVWSRFRSAQGAYCYFEQLYSGLARLTRKRLSEGGWKAAVADNRHPELERPYFAEFEPLLRRRGVRGYRRSFAFDRFALGADDRHAPLEAYLRGLTDFAAAQEARAVLGCNRTWLRVAWLKRRFEGYHLHVERDPLAVWSSYMRHAAAGNYNYFTNLHLILERNAGHPLFRGMAEEVRLRRGAQRLRKANQVYPELFRAMALEDSYALVLFMWAVGLLHGLTHADLVLDASLAEQPRYAAEIAGRVAHGCGLAVDFSGLKRVEAAVDLPQVSRRRAERRVARMLAADGAGVFDVGTVGRRLHQIAPAKADLLREMLTQAASTRFSGPPPPPWLQAA